MFSRLQKSSLLYMECSVGVLLNLGSYFQSDVTRIHFKTMYATISRKKVQHGKTESASPPITAAATILLLIFEQITTKL
uniref:Uncharacterized protein n=1 Tax=Romanomermis culicivorax TaxID=13658 RepID=A0A915HN94_ROMCU